MKDCYGFLIWDEPDLKAIKDNGWDYNSAYDTMRRLGVLVVASMLSGERKCIRK